MQHIFKESRQHESLLNLKPKQIAEELTHQVSRQILARAEHACMEQLVGTDCNKIQNKLFLWCWKELFLGSSDGYGCKIGIHVML